MSLTSQNATLPQCGCERLKLTYLFALADVLAHTRYSQDSITLERGGNAIITAGSLENRCAIKVEAGGKVSMARKGEKQAKPADSDTASRYARLFWRDNAEWFANFAAGREDLL